MRNSVDKNIFEQFEAVETADMPGATVISFKSVSEVDDQLAA